MNNVEITYEQVRADAETLKTCANAMESIFSSFETSMQHVGAEDVFVGGASESLQERFNALKPKFELYVKKVMDFASDVTMAANETERTETTLQGKAEEISN